MNEHLVLIDGFNLLSRAYFATSYGRDDHQLEKNSGGRYIHALKVFFSRISNLQERFPGGIVIAWDAKREDTIRNQDHQFYKAQRKDLPAPLIEQYHTATEICADMELHQMQVAGYEADDIIGSFTRTSLPVKKVIYSNDKDLFQLLTEETDQLFVQKRKEIHYQLHHFQEDYGIQPAQWIDVKALLGDPSDNIPGCPGVGAKAALPLIQMYGSVEGVYHHLEELDPAFNRYRKKLENGRESVMISRELVEIHCDLQDVHAVDLDTLQSPSQAQFRNVLEHYQILKDPFTLS
ncbi:5'-3' exonuclease [Alkalicoccus luteus]|uniref:5'-3' exonuclease n=1 Tax=Alkalicoccus luteus TaxID=1237094 RepID=UPI004033F487